MNITGTTATSAGSLWVFKSALTASMEAEKLKFSVDSWLTTQEARGRMVQRYRDYYDGNHDANLSTEQKQLFNIKGTGDETDHPFNPNYCGLVVDAPVDRLNLESIGADEQGAQDWAAQLLRQNRIDGLQLSVHEAAVRDADTYLLIEWDNDKKRVKFTHEPAYTPDNGGMVLLYESANSIEPLMAIKIWYTTGDVTADTMRVNVYTANEIRRYTGSRTSNLVPLTDSSLPAVERWSVGRVPVVHFRNSAVRHDNYGRSAIDDVIPLQDALNTTLISMVATSLLLGFPIIYALGIGIENNKVAPGVVWKYGGEISRESQILLGKIEAAQITPFVEQANFLIEQIATISKTPIPAFLGAANASGEALKDRESGLLAKVKRMQIAFGNSWEMAMELAALIQNTFSSGAPKPETSFYAQWAKAEVRNDTEVVDNVLKIADKLPPEELYRLLAPVYGWNEDKVKELADSAERRKQEQQRFEVQRAVAQASVATPDSLRVLSSQRTTSRNNGRPIADEQQPQPAA